MSVKNIDMTQLQMIVAQLREPQTGCAWDLQQTPASLIKHTLEETHELLHAICEHAENPGNLKYSAALCAELGDVLFHIVLYAKMADEANEFDLQTVINQVSAKMINRHPHIFAGKKYDSFAEQLADWDQIKQQEKQQSPNANKVSPLFADHLKQLPAILQGLALQNKLATLGFDWQNTADVFAKVAEELSELTEAKKQEDTTAQQAEFGDLLFSCLNLARHLDLDAELALRQANVKFARRSTAMIELAGDESSFMATSLTSKETLWQTVKQQES